MDDPKPVDFEDGMLDVGNGHSIYWRVQVPRHTPAMLVVGGPGGAMNLNGPMRWRGRTADASCSLTSAAAANSRRSASWSTTASMRSSAI